MRVCICVCVWPMHAYICKGRDVYWPYICVVIIMAMILLWQWQ
jgi:hypothetical protein